MHFPSLTSTLLVGCLCFAGISGNLDLNDVRRVNQELITKSTSQTPFFAFIAASTGRYLIEMPGRLSEDCVRTAVVTFNLYEKPSTCTKTAALLEQGLELLVTDPRAQNTTTYAIEWLCVVLNEQFQKSAADFPDFQQRKQNVQLPKPATNYYIKMQPGQSADQMLATSVNQLEDPAFLKVACATALLSSVQESPSNAELATISTAIQQLAKEAAYTASVDEAFAKLLDDYVKKLSAKSGTLLEKMGINHYPELNTMDQYFLANSATKEEYAKVKKEVADKKSQSKRY